MDNLSLLWVDARLNKTIKSYYSKLPPKNHWHMCDNVAQASSAIDLRKPDIVVFDFDYPDITGLKYLKEVREKFPNIPIIMLAEQHYESLCIWALRCRIWDYIPKPFSKSVFSQHLDLLVEEIEKKQNELMWQKLLPSNRIPHEASFFGNPISRNRINIAISYMEAHLHEKLSADVVSKQCGLTRYELSRAFKSEYSLTFRDFLLKLRMTRAAKMLVLTEASITDVSLSVGFNDLSHFSRKFHQFHGCSPGVYRRKNSVTQPQEC